MSGSGDGIVVTVNAARQNSALHVASYARLHVALFFTPLTFICMCPFNADDHVALGPCGDQVTVVDGAKFLTDFRSVDTIAARPQLQAVPSKARQHTLLAVLQRITHDRQCPSRSDTPSLTALGMWRRYYCTAPNVSALHATHPHGRSGPTAVLTVITAAARTQARLVCLLGHSDV